MSWLGNHQLQTQLYIVKLYFCLMKNVPRHNREKKSVPDVNFDLAIAIQTS